MAPVTTSSCPRVSAVRWLCPSIVCLPADVHLPWIWADGYEMSRKNAQLRRVIWCLSAVIAGLVLVIVPILFVRRKVIGR